MKDLKTFINANPQACLLTGGLAIIGYLGYRAIYWISHKTTLLIAKINSLFCNGVFSPSEITSSPLKTRWWTKITDTADFKAYKNKWENAARFSHDFAIDMKNQSLAAEVAALETAYNKSRPHTPLLGKIYGPFRAQWLGLWMQGVALLAAYLAEKKNIQGLYVCETLEALSEQIGEIDRNPADQRYALIVPTSSYFLGYKPNFPQHKVTVCIEKKEGQLTIVLLDSQPSKRNATVSPNQVDRPLWSVELSNPNNAQELVFRAILQGCRQAGCPARFLHSQVVRETQYGCGIFAIQDGIAFLRDLQFLNKVTVASKQIVIDHQYKLEVITRLPPECMVGTQSFGLIKQYQKQNSQPEELLIGRKKTLQSYLEEHVLNIYGKEQNHYITKKLLKYLTFVTLAVKTLKHKEIDAILERTLIKSKVTSTKF